MNLGMKWNERRLEALVNYWEESGQGRNRTADASLFRAAYRIGEVVLNQRMLL
jgi:hypothetical protein